MLDWLKKIYNAIVEGPQLVLTGMTAVVKLAAMGLAFFATNVELVKSLIEKLPAYVQKSVDFMQELIGVGESVFAVTIPPSFLAFFAFLNTILPITEIFHAMGVLVGFYILAVLVRVIKSLTIIYR